VSQIDVDDILNQKFSPEQMEESRKTLIDCRRRIANGEAIPAEELAENLKKIRVMYGREAQASHAKKKAPAKRAAPKKAKKVDTDSLLSGILGSL
jgi:hypothetical protein